MKKILAAGLAAATALTLSVAPAASAQSLALSSSSSSQAFAPEPQAPAYVQELENALEAMFNSAGQTRLAQYDRAAKSMLDTAHEGKVTWRANTSSPIDGAASASYRDSSYVYSAFRFSHSAADEVIENTRALEGIDLGIYGPYGLAVGSDNNWVYYVIAEPTRI